MSISDCGYTCHEQCQELVILDCKVDLTPDSDTSEEQLFLAAEDHLVHDLDIHPQYDPGISSADNATLHKPSDYHECAQSREDLFQNEQTEDEHQMSGGMLSDEVQLIVEDINADEKSNDDKGEEEKHEGEEQEKNEDNNKLKKHEVIFYLIFKVLF